jgi:hypothetical protein
MLDKSKNRESIDYNDSILQLTPFKSYDKFEHTIEFKARATKTGGSTPLKLFF